MITTADFNCHHFWKRKIVICFSCMLVLSSVTFLILHTTTKIHTVHTVSGDGTCWDFETISGNMTLGLPYDLRTDNELNDSLLKSYNKAEDTFGNRMLRPADSDMLELADGYKVPHVSCSANKERWKNTCPPYGLRPVKGSVHIAASRNYVDNVLHRGVAQELKEWVRQVEIPDETFFATLNYNPQLGIKGTFQGHPDENRSFVTRYKVWENTKRACAGKYIRDICILSTGDLPRLDNAVEMFANKFFLEEDRLVIGCLEEKLLNNTRDEYLGLKHINTSVYSSMDFVLGQVS